MHSMIWNKQRIKGKKDIDDHMETVWKYMKRKMMVLPADLSSTRTQVKDIIFMDLKPAKHRQEKKHEPIDNGVNKKRQMMNLLDLKTSSDLSSTRAWIYDTFLWLWSIKGKKDCHDDVNEDMEAKWFHCNWKSQQIFLIKEHKLCMWFQQYGRKVQIILFSIRYHVSQSRSTF